MVERAARRAGWFLELGAAVAAACAAAVGCTTDSAPPIAQNRVAEPPVEVEQAMRPLSVAPDANPAPDTETARADNVSVDARLLVITGDGSDPGLDAITQTLSYLGTPYDVLNASTGPTLTADYLAAGDNGRYYGIILDTGDLAVGSSSGFTDAEWMVLTSYETRFGVRRAVMYAHPTAAYGLQLTGGFDVKASPVALHCTSAASSVFVGANCAVPIAVTDGWAYRSQPADAFTLPLLVDTAGNVYAATRTYSDGREALVMTFAQSPTAMHTLELAYGVVNWVTRGLFIGERHVYMTPQLDDFYLASALYPTGAGTYRITAADLQAFTNWQSAVRAQPLTALFRAAFAFNATGAKPAGQDGLSDKARELGSTYEWINHTWDHKEMTAMAYAEAFEEFSKNNQFGLGSGLSRYLTENVVTPGITGLDNAEVMRAAYDVGIRQLVSDTSVAGQGNPSPNAGYLNAQVPGILSIPRRPTDLYFNVSQPSEWVTEYGDRHMGTFSYDQIIAAGSDTLVRYLLRGENDPWMFHQANIRDLGGGQSLFTTLMDATLAKYAACATFPVMSLTMEELAQRVNARMAFNASGVSATIAPGSKLTVRVNNAATIPITGVCTPAVEMYAGQVISGVPLAAGQSITLSLTDCNAWIPGTTGAGGAGGSDGRSSGAGGSTGPDRGGSGEAGATGSGAAGNTGALTTDAGPGPHPDTGCACLVGGRSSRLGVALVAIALAIAGRRARRRARAATVTRR